MNKITVTIGIPAYNAEGNIENIVNALLKQQTKNVFVSKILVYSDCSSDNTVKFAKRVKGHNVIVQEGKTRVGFTGVVKKLLTKAEMGELLILNDDIVINDMSFIEKICSPLLKENAFGMLCGNPLPLQPKTFVEKAGISAFKVYSSAKNQLPPRNNKHTVDGKVMLLTSRFLKLIKIPNNFAQAGNLDAFLYFSCLTNKLDYYFVKSAKVYFRFPNNLGDYIRWQIRNNTNKYILSKKFGKIVRAEYSFPLEKILNNFAAELINNPVGLLLITFIGFYARFIARVDSKKFNPTWTPIHSTKHI